MKLRIIRKWLKLSYPCKKYSYKTKDGVYYLLGRLTQNQAWLFWGKHRENYRKFLARRMKELMEDYEED